MRVICGQGPAPAAATIDAFRSRGFDLVPGTGPLAACVPGAFDAWMTLLRDFGTWEFADVAAFAIGFARDGFPATPGIVSAIARIDPAWELSAALWRPVDGRLRNPMLADMYARVVASGGATREARIDAARDAWYRGWVAERMVSGFVGADDLAGSAPRSRRRSRCGSATGRCSRPGRGARVRCSCSNSRCSTGSRWARS